MECYKLWKSEFLHGLLGFVNCQKFCDRIHEQSISMTFLHNTTSLTLLFSRWWNM